MIEFEIDTTLVEYALVAFYGFCGAMGYLFADKFLRPGSR